MQNMLHYEQMTAKLTSVTPLSEKHGNKRVPAQSLILEVNLINRRLDFFDDDLRHALYKVPDGTEPQPSLGMDPDDLEGLTAKRFPWMTQSIDIERELAGYTLIIDFGLGDDKSNIQLDAKKICDFKITVLDHGLFSLRHRFIVHPTTIEKGRIEEMLQQEIKVTLKPPVSAQGELLVEQPVKRGRGRPRKEESEKKTAAQKIAEEGDPVPARTDDFANTDIPPLQEQEQNDDHEHAAD